MKSRESYPDRLKAVFFYEITTKKIQLVNLLIEFKAHNCINNFTKNQLH